MKHGQLGIWFGLCGGVGILLIVAVILLGLEGSIHQLQNQMKHVSSKIDEHGAALTYLHTEFDTRMGEHAAALMSLHNEDLYVDSVVKPQ